MSAYVLFVICAFVFESWNAFVAEKIGRLCLFATLRGHKASPCRERWSKCRTVTLFFGERDALVWLAGPWDTWSCSRNATHGRCSPHAAARLMAPEPLLSFVQQSEDTRIVAEHADRCGDSLSGGIDASRGPIGRTIKRCMSGSSRPQSPHGSPLLQKTSRAPI